MATKKSGHQSPFKLLTTGALMWRKGYYYQLLVLKNLSERGILCNLTIIGSGNEMQGLKYTAQQLNISDRVIFTGQIPPNKVRDLLQESDVYLSTSVAEGLCNSVMEAAACGLPAVVFNCEGMSELIGHGLSGYIVPFGDLMAMTEAIESLYNDRELKESMAAAARARIEATFDASYWTTNMMEQYQHFIQTYG